MSIARWEFEHVRQFPNEVGLIFGDRAWTNAELHDRACRFAAALIGLGVGPGDRVAIALEGSPELFVACSGVVIAGAALVVLGSGFSSELRGKIEHCEPRVVVCTTQLSGPLAASTSAIMITVGDAPSAGSPRFEDLIGGSEPIRDFVHVPESTPVQLCYTSGSTGRPKAVPYSHGGLDRFLQSFAVMVPDRQARNTVLFCAPPTAFVSRLITLRALANNLYIVLSQFEAERALEAVEKYRVQQMSLLPTMAEQLVVCGARERLDCSSLQSINIGGSHVPAALVASLRKLAGKESSVRVTLQYGMTEAGGGIAATTEGGDGLVGHLMPGVVVRIGRSDGTDAQTGEPGEVIARTPFAPEGYWRDPEQTARVFRNGFVHTGDIGYFREDGQLVLVGRSKDVIIQGGVKIHPSELASVVHGLPGVRECAVVGCANDVLGEEVVVCVTRAPGSEVSESRIRAACRRALDRSRQPVRILFFDELPRTDGGKIDLETVRRTVSARTARRSISTQGTAPVGLPEARELVEREVRAILMDELSSAEQIGRLDPQTPFGELGLSSQGAVRLAHAVQERLGRDVPASLAYSCPTIESCAEWLATSPSAPLGAGPARSDESSKRQQIAIVGMGVRLPGRVSTPGEFWDLLWNGNETVGEVPGDRRSSRSSPWRAAFLPNVADFDAAFFRLSADAAEIDPRHRQLLEVCWEAFENAGLDPTALRSERTGVFLGLSGERYPSRNPLGAAVGMAAGYLCQFFDIRGPVATLDTTCSSSLTAVHHAVESLHRHECDLAVVGSANLLVEPHEGDPLGVMSRDGCTRPFDAAASGFGQGEGTLVLVLKRLDDAVHASDRVYACVLGSAVNHDGRSTSLAAPNPQSQAKAIALALEAAGIEGKCVQYVEAHGTGTPLGDPIEVDGLVRSVASGRRTPLMIGSVKSNIGHLEAAAGLAGVAKVALAIWRRRLPASRHCTRPNPRIAWEQVPVRVQSSGGEWPEPRERLVAGVSSFGMSGTNAHAVLAEGPASPGSLASRPDSCAAPEGRWVLPISARTATALRAAVLRWIHALEEMDEQTANCRDIAYSACCRRAHLSYRVAAIGSSRQEWVDSLRGILAKHTQTWRRATRGGRKLALVFSGQGSQWNGMARQLFKQEPVFTDVLTRCATLIEARTGWNVIDELHREDAESRLDETAVTQPTLFAIQVALHELWKAWGVDAAAAVGHSAGEIAAAYAAGALTLEESVQVICERARVCGEAPQGCMLAVAASVAEAQELCAQLPEQMEIAAINGPHSVVLSGSAHAASEAMHLLRSRGMKAVALPGARAFHSRHMQVAAAALRAAIMDTPQRQPGMLLISGMTAAPVDHLDGDYWSRQLLGCVRFSDAVHALLRNRCTAFLEVGPHPVLLPAIYEVLEQHAEDGVAVGSLRRGAGGGEALLESLGALYCAEVPIDWTRRFAAGGRHVDLPGYPWEHKRYWHDRAPAHSASGSPASIISLVERRAAANPSPEALVREALSDLVDAPLEDLRAHSSLRELGLDSLALIRLGTRLASRTGGPAVVSKPETTLGELMQTLAAPSARRSSPLSWLQREGAEPTYVWIHPGGGGIDCYRPLAASLPFRSIAIDSPDLIMGKCSDSSVEELAATYLGYLEHERVSEFLVLAGWSFGGVIAFEMAARLEREGRDGTQVILIDSHAGAALPANLQFPASELEQVKRVQLAHVRALRRYRPPRFHGPVLSLRAVPAEGDPEGVWREAAPNLRVKSIRADHFSIMRVVAKELSHAPELLRAGE